MQLLSQINIDRDQGPAMIQLLQGDLSAIPARHATDILVMAAFPGNYIALKGSLIYALQEKGLSVQALAQNKETDLRSQLHCWLSQPLSTTEQQQFNFKRILCFEPGEKIKDPQTSVNDIFRCINNFVFEDDNNVVAMPLIGTGYQQVPVDKMLPALLVAATFWLQSGLPLQCIKLVVHNEVKAQEALTIFNKFANRSNKETTEQPFRPAEKLPPLPPSSPAEIIVTGETPSTEPIKPPTAPSTKKAYDYFLSYAHVHAKEIEFFVEQLKSKNNKLTIFYDKDSIPPGGLWIQQISAAIQRADKVLVFLSPDYDNSPVCWDEFQCAKLMEYNRKKSIIQTVYLYGHKQTELPLIMGIYSYIDCREGNTEKIQHCVQQLLK
ncbi:toll/interleukin-1 receptor domain-containing protein [Terrimonas alba]|uniref:toll/interleukin-1 receptor domain-containing protein n=1 Tax=Terrimonas alba TaxID=3349636 RepID=UPI0035F2C5D6